MRPCTGAVQAQRLGNFPAGLVGLAALHQGTGQGVVRQRHQLGGDGFAVHLRASCRAQAALGSPKDTSNNIVLASAPSSARSAARSTVCGTST